ALLVALFLYVLVMRTRPGMLIRAGASNREMTGALGVNINLLYTLVFGLGAALAGLAGLMQADPDRADRHGREHIDTGLRGDPHRRDLLDPRRIPRRRSRRAHRHHRAGLPAGHPSAGAEFARGIDGRPCDVVDDDLPADGDRSGAAAGGSVSGVEQMIASLTPRNVVVAALLLLLAAVPIYAFVTGNAFLVTL